MPNMNAPNITVPNADDILVLNCPICDRQTALAAKSIIRGVEKICERCGAQIETLPRSVNASSHSTIAIESGGQSYAFDISFRTDGIWVLLDDAERTVLDVLEYDSDRSIAIIVGSLIENRLKRVILARINRHDEIESRLFRISGPLGSFSSKIDIARLLGFISDDAYHDLILMKDIRNLFAHNLAIRDFRSQRIKDKSRNFRLVDSHIEEFKPNPGEKTGPLVNIAHGIVPVLFVKHSEVRKRRARDRYLMTAQLLTVRFAAADVRSWPLPLI